MKILLLQLKRIGDLILTTPAIQALREARPEARLTLVVDASCGSLVEALDVDECWIQHKKAGWGALAGRGPNAWMTTRLPAFRGDYCLDFTGTDRSAWLALVSGCRQRVTYARFRKKFLRPWLYSDFVESSVRDRHTADHATDLLRPLGVNTENVPLALRLPETAHTTARSLLPDPGPYAVVHPGTARPEKYWIPERWAEVVQDLRHTHGLTPVFTGSRDPAEQAHLAAIQAALPTPCPDLSGQTNLLELAAVIGRARVFCGVDTAAMHLADAMKTPAVALFGPTNPYHWRPRHTRAVILRSNTVEPFSPGQKGGPMEQITLEAVKDGIRRLLN